MREWRKHRGYTLAQLAEMIGTSPANLSRIEKMEQPYTQDFLEIAAEALMTDPATLIMRHPDAPNGVWTVWDSATPAQRKQIEAVVAAIMKTATQF